MKTQSKSNSPRRLWFGLLAGLVLAGAAWLLLDHDGVRSMAPAASVTPAVESGVASTADLPILTADGFLVPAQEAVLSLAASNTVAVVHVQEGDWVEAGAPLITLENRAQQAALAQAQASLAQSQANLERLQAGARPEEIAQARAAVEVATMALYRLVDGATPTQIASADKAIAAAQANLARVQAGATPAELTAAEATLHQAEAALRNAQSAYNQVAWANDIGARPESLKLEQATFEYERAQAQYNNVVDGATPEEIQVARAQVAQAQAAKDELLATAHPADIATAQANVRAASAALELLEAGARGEEVAAAQAQVAAAAAAVMQAQAALDATILTAPFAGLVSSVAVSEGEFVAPGAPIVRLGATQQWVVETDTLSELDVVKLHTGDAVTVAFDALPGASFQGTVTHIQPASEFKRGDVTYTATIALDADTGDLRWGMSAVVNKWQE